MAGAPSWSGAQIDAWLNIVPEDAETKPLPRNPPSAQKSSAAASTALSEYWLTLETPPINSAAAFGGISLCRHIATHKKGSQVYRKKQLTCQDCIVTSLIMTCQTRFRNMRMLVAGVAACLLVLQVMIASFAEARGSVAPASDQTTASVAAQVVCHSDDGATPSKGDHRSCTHCPLCSNGARSDVVILTPLRIIISVAFTTTPANPPGWMLDKPLPPKPQGWSSSWSSRAPPFFS